MLPFTLPLLLGLVVTPQTITVNETVELATLGVGAADHATLAINAYGDVLVANHAVATTGTRLVEATAILSQGDFTFEILAPTLLGDPTLNLVGQDSCTKPDVVALADDSFVVTWPRGNSLDLDQPSRLEAVRIVVRDPSGALYPNPHFNRPAPGEGYVLDATVVAGDGGVMPDLASLGATDPLACVVVYSSAADVYEGVTKKFREFDLRACRIDFQFPASSPDFLEGPEVLVAAIPLDEYHALPYVGGLILPDVVLDEDRNLVVANEEELLGPHFGLSGPARSRLVVRRFRPFDAAQPLELLDEVVLGRGDEFLRPRRPNLSSCLGDGQNDVLVSWFYEGLQGNLDQVQYQTIPYQASSHAAPVDGYWIADPMADEFLSTATATDDLRACLAIRDLGQTRSLRATTTSSSGSTAQFEIPTPIDFPVRPAAQLATFERAFPGTDILFCPISYEGSDQGAHGQSRIWFTYRRL